MHEIRQAFRDAGLRHTRQREAVYAALLATKTHPTAEQVFEMVRRSDHELSLATIYNSLEALVDSGLCQRLPASGGPARYDADVNRHVHLMLPDGRVLDVPNNMAQEILGSLPGGLVEALAREAGVEIGGISVQLLARDAEPVKSPPDA